VPAKSPAVTSLLPEDEVDQRSTVGDRTMPFLNRYEHYLQNIIVVSREVCGTQEENEAHDVYCGATRRLETNTTMIKRSTPHMSLASLIYYEKLAVRQLTVMNWVIMALNDQGDGSFQQPW
jgi:hypothetical protein